MICCIAAPLKMFDASLSVLSTEKMPFARGSFDSTSWFESGVVEILRQVIGAAGDVGDVGRQSGGECLRQLGIDLAEGVVARQIQQLMGVLAEIDRVGLGGVTGDLGFRSGRVFGPAEQRPGGLTTVGPGVVGDVLQEILGRLVADAL